MSSPAGPAEFERPRPVDSNKRRAEEPPDSGVKRRASRACLSCRNRKVRCDVTNRGTPCTNCSLDNVNCRLTVSIRGRVRGSTNASKDARSIAPTNRSSTTSTTTSTSASSSDSTGGTSVSETVSRPTTVPDDFPESLTFEGSRESMKSNKHFVEVRDGIISPRSSITTPETATWATSHASVEQQAHGLPSFIRPLPDHLNPIDIEYLTKKGALTLPNEELQIELLRKYLLYVHPFMPVLNISEFLSPIATQDGNSPVGLLIFQSVMFAGSVFIDAEYIIASGYQNRRALRKELFERARLLYDHDCEMDRIAVLQALLLMSYWYDKPEDEKATWYWTGVALSLAQVLGMHRNPDHLGISPAMKRLRKRIWWSCFVRDRLLAVGIRRPARIRPGDYDVPMLTMEDCQMQPLTDNILNYLGPRSLSSGVPTNQCIMLCFIELTKLGIHIGDILFTQYSTLGNPARGAEENITMMVMPRGSPTQMQEMAACDHNLEDWLQDLDPACRYKDQKQTEDSESDPILRLHQALLYMIYQTTMVILHRPQALRPSSSAPDSGVNTQLSRDKVTEAASCITEVAYDLHKDNQLRFASTSAIPALLSATLIHLIDIRYSSDEIRYSSIGRFYQCWQSLQSLREMYASADHAIWFLVAVIQKTNINVPMLNLPSLSTNSGPVRKQPGDLRVQIGFRNGLSTSQVPEQTGLLATTGNPLVTPLSFENSVIDGIHFPPRPLAHLPQSEMGDTAASELQGGWAGIDTEENLLQALINFDANPNYFTPASIGQAELLHSLNSGNVGYT